MADKTISELPAAPSQLSLYDGTELFVLQQANEAKKLQMQILENWLVSIADGHGGIQRIELTGSTTTDPVVDTYTIIYADLTTSTFTVTNGARGPQGEAMYLYVRYADTGDSPPSQDSDMSIVPGPWVGTCATTASDPSTLHVGDFTWFHWQGPAGTPITSVVRTAGDGSPGSTDTYTMYVDADPVGTFTVYQGVNGTGSVASVDNQFPDGAGNVTVNAEHIPYGESTVQAALDTLPMWRGKHALIIGDSWAAGVTGSGTTTPWTSTFLGMTGMSADIARQSAGGFTKQAGASGTYPNENYIEVLEHFKANDYDIIITQDGVNDIIESTADIAAALSSFKAKCSEYWPGVPVFLFVTVPFYYLVGDYNARAITLVNNAVSLGYYVDTDTALISKSGSEYKGTDNVHPSAAGQEMLGRMAAGFVSGQNMDFVGVSATYPTDSYVFRNFAFSAATSNDYLIRVYRKHISVYIVATITQSDTAFITVATGLPHSEASYTFLSNAIDYTNHTPIAVPVYVTDDRLLIQNETGASLTGRRLLIAGTYTTYSL